MNVWAYLRTVGQQPTLFALALAIGGCEWCDLPFANCVDVIETECWSHPSSGERPTCSSDEREPNDTMPTADSATNPSCSTAAPTRRGTIAGDDVDFFRSSGSLCEEDDARPTLTLTSGNVRACLFIQCRTGSTGLERCTDGTIPMHMPNGLLGCCRDGPGEVSGDFACSSNEPKVNVYLVVDGSGTDECVPYEVSYKL